MKNTYLIYHRNIFVFIISGMVLLSSCGNNSTKVTVNGNVENFKFSSFKKQKNIEFSPISDFPQGDPSNFLIADSNHLVINSLNQNDSYYLYILTKKGQVLKNLLKRGMGPQEAISSGSVGIMNDKFYGFDMSKCELFWCYKDSLINNQSTTFNKVKLANRFIYDLVWLNDSIIVATGVPTSKSKLLYHNLYSQKDIAEIGEFPTKYIGSFEAFKDAATSYIDISPNKEHILVAYRFTDVIEIYNNMGQLTKTLQGPMVIDLAYEPKEGYAKQTKKAKKAFVNTYATNENFYLLFSGETIDNSVKSICGNYILVISWDGELKEVWNLNEPIYAFAIDENNHMLYSHSYSKNGALLKADLL